MKLLVGGEWWEKLRQKLEYLVHGGLATPTLLLDLILMLPVSTYAFSISIENEVGDETTVNVKVRLHRGLDARPWHCGEYLLELIMR